MDNKKKQKPKPEQPPQRSPRPANICHCGGHLSLFVREDGSAWGICASCFNAIRIR